MTRIVSAAVVLMGIAPAAAHLAATSAQTPTGWTMLFSGKNLDAFTPTGNANWKIVDGVVQADSGSGFLVTKEPYGDFEMKLEFWVDEPANSGVFIRCADAQKIGAESCYEVNIFDTRPDPTYGTGAIVNVAKAATPMKAGGKWNTYEIRAQGPRMIVRLNDTQTVDVRDTKLPRGPIALQYSAGVVKFRNVQIRRL